MHFVEFPEINKRLKSYFPSGQSLYIFLFVPTRFTFFASRPFYPDMLHTLQPTHRSDFLLAYSDNIWHGNLTI